MNDNTKSWSKMYEFRRRIRRRFPNFWSIKIIKKPFDAIRPYLKENISVLDIGSGNRQMGGKLKNIFPNITYKSMDIDKGKPHDYYSMDDINEKFDIVLLFEVIEHLEFEEAVILLKKARLCLKPNGRLIITTPNIYHPNRYWEYSHRVSYRYDEIGALLLALGYNVKQIYRIYNAPIIQRTIRVYLMSPVHYYFGIDFAKSIVVIAETKGEGDSCI